MGDTHAKAEILVAAGTTAGVSVAATLTATAVFKKVVSAFKPVITQVVKRVQRVLGSLARLGVGSDWHNVVADFRIRRTRSNHVSGVVKLVHSASKQNIEPVFCIFFRATSLQSSVIDPSRGTLKEI